jgi:hypothetical protein
MVVGLDKFKQYFADHSREYVIIGGTACDLIFNVNALTFRATKDIDLVLCVEVVNTAFASAFADFVAAAGYQRWSTAEGEPKFFRYESPTDKSFPHMIELFARPPVALALPQSDRHVRLDVEDAIISLSALLLDAAYYDALKTGACLVDGVLILDETLLIPFKAKAFLDLTERKARNEPVRGDDIRKHRNDVFRLLQLLTAATSVTVVDSIKDDLRRFEAAMADEAVDPTQFDVPLTKEEGLDLLRTAYGL